MSGHADDTQDKPHEPSPQKLRKAREKGEVARSADLSVAAGYAGLLLAGATAGAGSVAALGSTLMVLLDQPDRLADLVFGGPVRAPMGGIMLRSATALAPWFALPAAAILLSILGQRAWVVAPAKLRPKLSRVSIPANARNKFGRSGLFEFAKSFFKLLLYSVCLGVFLNAHLPTIIPTAAAAPQAALAVLVRLSGEFLLLVVLIAASIGGVDALWQHTEHRRRNRMSRKELADESKEAEGDPHMKQERRQRGQQIAMSQMIADVHGADVVVVNPTHYAVALKWSRLPGSAPVCVAKGVDEVAATIRRTAEAAGVPVHGDPPTARALYATVDIGQQIGEEHFAAVAAAIRFAEKMRDRARRAVQ